MEAIIFIGIQGSGKTSFYKENFFNSHIRISLDLLNTRNKQQIFLQACLDTQSRFVVDNTNPERAEREKIIAPAKERKYRIVGYYFHTTVAEAIERNNQRRGKEKIPERGIRGCYRRLVLPTYEEGYDKLYQVEIQNNTFVVTDYHHGFQ